MTRYCDNGCGYKLPDDYTPTETTCGACLNEYGNETACSNCGDEWATLDTRQLCQECAETLDTYNTNKENPE
jgi:hypothetical protein